MPANISVYVQPREYPSDDDYSFTITLSECWIREFDIPLDEPTNFGAELISSFQGNTYSFRTEIMRKRAIATDMLSKAIAKNICEFFDRNDMTNGYKNKRKDGDNKRRY